MGRENLLVTSARASMWSDVLQKEQELHESEERVSLAAEAANLGIWELDNTTGTVWMSDRARELFRFDSGANVSYASFQSRVHPEDRGRHDAAVKYAIQAQANYEIDYRVLLPKGAQRWIVGRGRCVPDANGKFTRLLGVSADIRSGTSAGTVSNRHGSLAERNFARE